MIAVSHHQNECVDLLLSEAGMQDYAGNTALIHGIMCNNNYAVQVLKPVE